MLYPKWRYHETEEAMIVRDPEHEGEATPDEAGWVDHPSQLSPKETPAGKKTKK